MAADFVKLSDTHWINADAVTCVMVAAGDPLTACVHFAHGKEEITGDEAIELLDHLGAPQAKEAKAAKKAKEARDAKEAKEAAKEASHAPAHARAH